jgi:hypothetical protein
VITTQENLQIGKLYACKIDLDMRQFHPKDNRWYDGFVDTVDTIKALQPFVVLDKDKTSFSHPKRQPLFCVKVLTTNGVVGWLILAKFDFKLIKNANQ